MAESVDSEVCTLTISKTSESPSPDNIPAVLESAGLTEARRKYLIDKVKPFCRPENQAAFIADLH